MSRPATLSDREAANALRDMQKMPECSVNIGSGLGDSWEPKRQKARAQP